MLDEDGFEDWVRTTLAKHGDFTALVVLTQIADSVVRPVCSTFFHIIGDELSWGEIVKMLETSGQKWQGAAFFATKSVRGGPVDNATARQRLRELEARIMADRMTLNDGEFFDALGRRIRIDPEPLC
jgi:hypothetical protein